METESSLRKDILKNKQDGVLDKDKTVDNIKNIIFVIMYHRHKLLDLILTR
jgi:hypothetical protein